MHDRVVERPVGDVVDDDLAGVEPLFRVVGCVLCAVIVLLCHGTRVSGQDDCVEPNRRLRHTASNRCSAMKYAVKLMTKGREAIPTSVTTATT